jgi:hypothetical protein
MLFVNFCVFFNTILRKIFYNKMESLNIINLIEKNNITRLNKSYENNLVKKYKIYFQLKNNSYFLLVFLLFKI